MVLLRSLTVLMLFGAPSAKADLNKCFSSVRESIRSCDDRFNSANGMVNSTSSEAIAQSDGFASARGGAESQLGAVDSSSAVWAPVVPHCTTQRQKCATDCNSVRPQEKSEAEKAKHDCFGKINQKIAIVNQVLAQNQSAALGSANTGNSGGAQGAEKLDGDIHKVSSDGISNIDMLRRLQKTHDCSTSGSGGETRCVGTGGTVYVPTGPDSAFKPYRPQ